LSRLKETSEVWVLDKFSKKPATRDNDPAVAPAQPIAEK
jgi:hypothetical protein